MSQLTGKVRAAVGALVLAMAGAGLHAEEAKPLVRQWLDGDLPYSGPKINYDGKPITIRFSTFIAPGGSIVTDIWQQAFDRLAADTGGKLVIKPFWASSLADAQRGAFEVVESGVAQMSSCYVSMNPAGFDLQLGLQMPFLVNRSTASSMAIQELYPTYFRNAYESKGVYLARSGTTPPNQLLTTGAPVVKLEDMAGKKVWGIGQIPTAVLKALGAVPVALPPSDLYVSMQSGVLDVTPMHDAGTKLFRLSELAKSRTVANLTGTPMEYCLNKAFFDDLPEDLKGAFYLWLQKFNHAEMELYFDADAARARNEMAASGVTFVELSDEEMQRWKDAVQPAIDDWVSITEAKGLPAAKFLEDYKALTAKYEAMSDDELFQKLLDQPLPGLISGFQTTN